MTRATSGIHDDNRVFLRGRLAAEAVIKVLPSGDELCSFRLTVARPPGGRRAVDSLECCTVRPGRAAAWSGRPPETNWR